MSKAKSRSKQFLLCHDVLRDDGSLILPYPRRIAKSHHAEGGWQPRFSERECETIFANLEKMGCPLVRIWAFERQEGLMFTRDLSTDSRYPYHEVTGLDPVFLENCRTIMKKANEHHVKVYWSLLNHLIREEQGGRHMRIITDAKVRASYINNAAVPFLKEFGKDPAFWAVDIINEAEGAITGLEALSGSLRLKGGCSWKEMRAFIRACADAFHAAVPGIQVTSTSGWHEEASLKAGRFSGLGLDFYDWHSYKDNPVLPAASDLGLDKPVILGECGPRTNKPDADYAFQGKNWRAYFEQARRGYAGILTWSYGNPGSEENMVMVNKDHSWRAGARAIYEYSRGNLFPDAGPILLTDEEKADLPEINEAISILFSAANDRLLADPARVNGKLFISLVNQCRYYYPYLNPNFAKLRLRAVCKTLADLGDFEVRQASSDPDALGRTDRLREIGSAILAKITSSRLRTLAPVARLIAFTSSSGTTANSAVKRSSPFGESIINIRSDN